MLKTVIIADDLTGANDTGAILAQDGFHVGTVIKRDRMEDFSSFNTLCVSTDSRAMSAEDAYEAVRSAAALFPHHPDMLWSKRIDSTLRGNVGAEIDAILDHLGEDYHAIVVASFPGSGRSCVGDILLVHGVPLQLTEVSRDPITPITTSRVTSIVRQQTRHEVGYIGLEVVAGPSLGLLEELHEVLKKHRVVVIDAATPHDIRAIAACCAASGEKIVAIDPGSFTAALADYTFNRAKYETEQSILCVVGSATELTQKQIAYLRAKDDPFVVKAEVARFFEPKTRAEEINRLVEAITSAQDRQILAIVTTESAADLLNFDDIPATAGMSRRECATTITAALAEASERILELSGERIGGLYASGGDVSIAICERLGISGFDVKMEVIPLAIYSRLAGGTRPQMPVVTKGGLVGKEDTLFQCVDYLKEKIK
ncbi:hypothetical protein K6V98_01910 [Collinsella sp. AGMB00827]|uniref:Four-carbon acid sugar kinase family protein n=1 Tax=Collinsella ureilytica TaxID=2869515 RepID=A0ABS7ML48_9ACTN|nr:four-carbon acid sugar kinase family protein [Collinsella urealyticum]MBY4797120.1 hypothetical protein [Collinsella urealyticum]